MGLFRNKSTLDEKARFLETLVKNGLCTVCCGQGTVAYGSVDCADCPNCNGTGKVDHTKSAE